MVALEAQTADKSHLRLHEDVEIHRSAPGEYLVLNLRTNERFTVGEYERYLLFAIQKSASVEDIQEGTDTRFGQRLSRRDLTSFLNELEKRKLLEGSKVEQRSESRPKQRGGWVNFAFDVLLVLFGWIISPFAALGIAVLAMGGAAVAWNHSSQIYSDFRGFFSTYSIQQFFVMVVLPKLFFLSLIQGLLTAMACRKSGGRVSEAGIGLRYGFVPVFETKLDSSFWLLDKRRRRVFFSVGFWSALGMLSLSLVGWAIASPTSTLRHILPLFVVPCLIRLVIQLNPFLRTSFAYLTIVETMREPDLLLESRKQATGWLCGDERNPRRSEFARMLLFGYGLMFYAYKIFIVGSLIVGGYWLIELFDLGGAIVVLFVSFEWIRSHFDPEPQPKMA